jgi:hypothetical protein
MGRHEEPLPDRADDTLWGTARRLARLPKAFLLMLLAIVIGLAIVSVAVQNAYGGIWGAPVSAGLAPFVASMLLRGKLRRRDTRPRSQRW